jgi:hypothetical protein
VYSSWKVGLFFYFYSLFFLNTIRENKHSVAGSLAGYTYPQTGELSMGQVAFDTQEFVETLENAGLPKDQARAISIAVRKSHEVADVATRRDLEDARKDLTAQITEVKKDLSAEIAEARKDTAAQFDKTDAKIAEVRKDLSAEMNLKFERTDAQVALLRKDIESLTNKLVIKMASIMVGVMGVATAIIKLF